MSGNRTPSGAPSASARDKFGSGDDGKAFPVFDHTSAVDALRLRGHNKNLSESGVVDKVANYANAHGDSGLKAAVAKAREESS
jgi:hypothetical protein